MSEQIFVGTAGWSIPSAIATSFPSGGSTLARYAQCFHGVEIDSTFYRSHRASNYARWRESVPDGFRFAIKVPKAISHEKRLVGAKSEFLSFLSETSELGAKRGPLLLQLPPSLTFDAASTATFLALMRNSFSGDFVIEPRHASWFTPPASSLLVSYSVSRVGADPPRQGQPFATDEFSDMTYLRLHGSPRSYFSAYDAEQITAVANILKTRPGKRWVIFDNTASGAATGDALRLTSVLKAAGRH